MRDLSTDLRFDASEGLTIIACGGADYAALTLLRGAPPFCPDSGRITVSRRELRLARAAYFGGGPRITHEPLESDDEP